MRKKLIVLLFLFLIPITFVSAGWVLDYDNGEWVYKYHYMWKSTDNSTNAIAVYLNNQSDFKEWSFGVTLDDYSMTGVWFWAHMYQVFNATFTDWNNVTTYQIIINSRFMLPNSYKTDVLVYENGTLQNKIEALAFGYAHAYIWKDTDNDTLKIDTIYKESKETNGSYVIRHFERNVTEAFFSNVRMTQTIKKDMYNGAFGFIEGTKHDEIISSGIGQESPNPETEMSLADKILYSIWHDLNIAGKIIYDLLPESIQNVWDITFGTLLGIVQFLLGTLAPNVLTYFSIYVIMLAISCFLTATEIIGEEYEFGAGQEQTVFQRVKDAFQPLFDLFLRLWDIGIKIFQIVLDIIF